MEAQQNRNIQTKLTEIYQVLAFTNNASLNQYANELYNQFQTGKITLEQLSSNFNQGRINLAQWGCPQCNSTIGCLVQTVLTPFDSSNVMIFEEDLF